MSPVTNVALASVDSAALIVVHRKSTYPVTFRVPLLCTPLKTAPPGFGWQ